MQQCEENAVGGGSALVQVNQTEDHLDEEIGWCLWPWVLGATEEVKLL